MSEYLSWWKLVLSAFWMVTVVNCLSIQDVEEGPCINVPVDQNFDLLWISNYAEWYYPISNKYDVYQWAVSLSGLPEKNVTEDMVRRSCMIIYVGSIEGATHTAFRGTKRTIIDPYIADHGVFEWSEKRNDGTPGFRGRTHVSLTDNDKYYVAITCWEKQNQRGYSVLSNVRTLDQESITRIRNHLKSLGFNVEKNWLDMQYDNCVDLSNPEEYEKISREATSTKKTPSSVSESDSQNKTKSETGLESTNISLSSLNRTLNSLPHTSSQNATQPNVNTNQNYNNLPNQPINQQNNIQTNSNPFGYPQNNFPQQFGNFPNNFPNNYQNSQNNFQNYPNSYQRFPNQYPNYNYQNNPINLLDIVGLLNNQRNAAEMQTAQTSSPNQGNSGNSNKVVTVNAPNSNRQAPASEYFFDIFRAVINYLQKLYGDVMKNIVRVAVRIIGRLGLGSILL